jgi:hypothetical protein
MTWEDGEHRLRSASQETCPSGAVLKLGAKDAEGASDAASKASGRDLVERRQG